MAQKNKKTKKKSNLPLILAAIAVICVVRIAVTVPSSNKQSDIPSDAKITASDTNGTADNANSNGSTNSNDSADSNDSANNNDSADSNDSEASGDVQVIESGGSLIIPVSEVSETAQFYPVEVDGTRMEIIAVKDSDGNIRTAFNTCQVCYSSGRGYYVQDGDALVCQNCGNRFTVDQVEIQSGGCNPWPIFAENKTVTDDSIEISYDFLNESKKIFANWKTVY